MGRSTGVRAFICPEEPNYKKQAAVLKACLEAEINMPAETAEYFGCREPYLGLLDDKLETEIAVEPWGNDCTDGYEIFVKDIPKGVYKIRFYNSW